MARSRHWSVREAARAVRHASLTLAPLLPLSAARVLDVALEHPVFEALLLQDGLGDVMKRHDALQRRALHHRNVARMLLEHRASQFHHVKMRRRDQRITLA